MEAKQRNDKEIRMRIGRRLRKLRRQRDATQKDFAEEIGITANFLSEVECGKKGISCETLYHLCEALQLSADDILFGTGEGKQRKPPIPADYGRGINASENAAQDFACVDTIIRLAEELKQHELNALIDYLTSLKTLREQLG